MKTKIKDIIILMKRWGFVEWIVNFRFIGYALILLKSISDNEFTIVEGMAFCVIVGLIENKAKSINK